MKTEIEKFQNHGFPGYFAQTARGREIPKFHPPERGQMLNILLQVVGNWGLRLSAMDNYRDRDRDRVPRGDLETWRPGRGTLTLRNGIFRVVLIRLDKEKGKSEADPGGVLWSEQECRVCLAFSNMSRVKRLVGMRPQERALGLARQESGSTEDGFTRVQVVNGVHSGVRIWRRYQTGGFEAIPGGGNQKPPPTFLWHLPKQDSSPQIRHFRLQPALTLFRPGPASTGPNLRSAFDGPRSRRNSLQGQSDCVSE